MGAVHLGLLAATLAAVVIATVLLDQAKVGMLSRTGLLRSAGRQNVDAGRSIPPAQQQ
jgi:hypothetical protein